MGLREVVRDAVDEAKVEVARPRTPRIPSLREQRDLTVRRVLDEFARSGTLPGTLRRKIADDEMALRWAEGRPLTRDKVEAHIDEWAAQLLETYDRKDGVRRTDSA